MDKPKENTSIEVEIEIPELPQAVTSDDIDRLEASLETIESDIRCIYRRLESVLKAMRH